MVSLVRITFRIVFISERLHCPRSVSAADTLTATALLPSRGLAKCTNDVPVNNVSRSTCDVTIESGYGDSDTSFNSVSSSCGISCHPCDFLDRTLLNGHSCKRPRCEAPGLTTNVISNSSAVHSATVTSGRVQPIATASPSRISPNKNVSGDDGEIDRRPFKSKLACDIVRAAFADRVQLEELLAECRRSDFAISALDRSPMDRMMEATDYIVGIMAYEQIRETKAHFQVGDFLASGKQPNLTTDMLTTLADWLVEVQDNFGFNHETIHLAWGLLYAYFERGQPLARREIQLMACAAIMIACKHEERQMPQLSEFLYITDSAYTKEEFIEAERRFLVAIDFAVHRPNPYVFLRRYARVLDAHSGHVQFMSRFLLEAGMHSHAISLKRESQKAAAALWLSRVVLRNPSYVEWTRRTDVYQLRQFLRANRHAQRFYSQCCPRPAHTLLRNRPVGRTPNLCTSIAAGPLDLSKRSTSVRSVSAGLSRSGSLCHQNSFLADNVGNWLSYVRQSQLNPVERSNSEPKKSRNTTIPHTYSPSYKSAPVSDDNSSCSDLEDNSLDPELRADLEAMKSEEDQRSPFWPPILQHITGYKEADLIPLAVRYHAIALRLIAEVARGGRLATEKDCETANSTAITGANPMDPHLEEMDEDTDDGESNNPNAPRCISPGGHYLRRQAVSKYCSE
ncbi:G2/mitotic-specific cyclin-B3 [Fasciolopsis buskii]|uniref:G2/mitotic-specific cyclin-B3 n=1 Tax=Fasciolopsis buskii TaxID=27845 RepID=A0A8E0VLF8_9TREM|nr:G2/mitotic-specific cyclin-B3 [Fasciolopsis buski]